MPFIWLFSPVLFILAVAVTAIICGYTYGVYRPWIAFSYFLLPNDLRERVRQSSKEGIEP